MRNEIPAELKEKLKQELRFLIPIIISIFAGVYLFIITTEPQLNPFNRILSGVFAISLAGLYFSGWHYWEFFFRNPRKLLLWAIFVLVTLFSLSIASGGRFEIYSYIMASDGYGALLYFSKKRRWGIIYTISLIIVTGAGYFFLWESKEATLLLLNDLPWYVLSILGAEFVMRYWIQRDQLAMMAIQLADAHKELQEYTKTAEELAMTQERHRLAREIHDTLGHTLIALDIQSELLARLPSDRKQERQQAQEKMRNLVKLGISDLRGAVKALRPVALESFTLSEAIAAMVKQYKNLAKNEIKWELQGKVRPLPEQNALAFYRVAQEALTNIQRHAPNTPSVFITLNFHPSAVTLIVKNASDPSHKAEDKNNGFGLQGLRERAELLGGYFQAGQTEEGGFQVEMSLNS